jgi:hypothetical protein
MSKGYRGFSSKQEYEEYYSDIAKYASEVLAMQDYTREAQEECQMPVNSPYYIVLNGPPEVGKSTIIARGLLMRLQIYYHCPTVLESFAAPIKHFLATALGMKYNAMKKDTMLAVLQGYTPREFLIGQSEYIRNRYGNDIFGRLLEYRVLRIDPMPDFVIIDDGGFEPEVSVLGYSRRIIQVRRPGKDYTNDSRSYLPDPNFILDNDGSVEALNPKLDALALWCIGQLPTSRRPRGIVL